MALFQNALISFQNRSQLIITIFTVSTVMFVAQARATEEPAGSKVGSDKVMVRSSGSPLRIVEKITATLNAGSVLHVGQRDGEWLWIDSGNIQGWIKSVNVVPLDEAVSVFTESIEQAPHAAEGYLGRGLARQASGDRDGALADFSKAIELDPKNHWAYHDRAVLYFAKGDFPGALTDSDQAIQLDPAEAAHLANRASAHFALKDFDKAIADYTEAISRLKGNEAAVDYEGNVSQPRARRLAVKWTCARAECWAAKNVLANAVKDYSEAARIDPSDPLTFNSFAWILATSEDSRIRDGIKAFDLAAQACDLTGFRNHLCLDTLATAYACAGDFAAAVKWQVNAISLAESNSHAKTRYRDRLNLFMKNQAFLNLSSR